MQIKNMCDPQFKRGIHLDFHTPELDGKIALTNFSGKQWAAQMKKAHVQWATIFAKCHFGNSYYFTDVGHRHKNMECDLMREAINALHEEGIRVSAYYSLAWDKYASDTNPDWQERRVNGDLLGDKLPWGLLCVNSPYMDELVLPQIREICNYNIDGIFIDIAMYQPEACFCQYCQEKYRRKYAKELVINGAVTDPNIQKQFHASSMLQSMKRISDTAKSLISGCEMVMNASHEIGQYLPLLNENIVDVTMIEAQGGSPHGGYNTIATQCRYARTLEKPFQIVNVRFHEGWGAMTMKTVEQMKYEFILTAVHGGQVICGDQVAWDGSLYSSVYDNVAQVFNFLKERHDTFVSCETIKFAALLYGKESPFPYSAEFPEPLMGGSKALTELHEQFDIINIEHMNKISAYRLLLVPSGTKFTEKQAIQIRKYIKNGGNLYLEYDAGTNSESCHIIDELTACTFKGFTHFNCSYVENSEAEDFPLLIPEPLMLIKNDHAEILRAAYNPITEYDPPLRAFRHLYPTPEFHKKYPGITITQPFHGGGKVARSAFPLFKAYWKNNYYWIRRIISETLEAFELERLYKSDAPSTVEFNMTKRGKVTILHCINFHAVKTSTSPYSNIEEILPVNVELELPRLVAPKSLILLPQKETMDFTYEDGIVKLSFKLDEVHLAIEIH